MELSEIKYSVDYSKFEKRIPTNMKYDLYSPAGREIYFNDFIGEEIQLLRNFLKKNTFVGYMLAPKQAGKGTYTTQLKEILGDGYFENISVGDLIRTAEQEYLEKSKDSGVYKYTAKNYRGFTSLDEVFNMLTHRSTSNLSVPTEFVIVLIKREIDRIGKKSIFIDGFPRSIEQINNALYMRDLINYRDDPDFFVLINIPMAYIDARIKGRRNCPVCRNARHLEMNPTSIIGFDNDKDEFYLECDNPSCVAKHVRMEMKEGDEKGMGLIKDRIINDIQLMEMARKMHGIKIIEIYNALEVHEATKYSESFEWHHHREHKVVNGKVVSNLTIMAKEDHGKEYYSMLPPWIMVNFVKDLVKMFDLKK